MFRHTRAHATCTAWQAAWHAPPAAGRAAKASMWARPAACCSPARPPTHCLPPAADMAAIDAVLAAGTKPTGDCYTWER